MHAIINILVPQINLIPSMIQLFNVFLYSFIDIKYVII